MPYASDRSARLFYDDSCGPCRLLARTAEAVSHHRVVATPLDAPSADGELGRMDPGLRYGYAHLAVGRELRTGEQLTVPLVGLALGTTWERVIRTVPPLDRSLRWAYLRLWGYRRTHGCGARSHG
jgi:hypothetical protein